MDSLKAQLAPVASSLDELKQRITALADAQSGSQDDIARDLYEVERSIVAAYRRLDRLVNNLG